MREKYQSHPAIISTRRKGKYEHKYNNSGEEFFKGTMAYEVIPLKRILENLLRISNKKKVKIIFYD